MILKFKMVLESRLINGNCRKKDGKCRVEKVLLQCYLKSFKSLTKIYIIQPMKILISYCFISNKAELFVQSILWKAILNNYYCKKILY